jgi:hypothetical protein
MHTVQIKQHEGTSMWVSGSPGFAMQIRHPGFFLARLEGDSPIETKGRDRETALGECLLQAASSPLAGLTLPPELRELSAHELGLVAAGGGVHDVQVIDVLRSGNSDQVT